MKNWILSVAVLIAVAALGGCATNENSSIANSSDINTGSEVSSISEESGSSVENSEENSVSKLDFVWQMGNGINIGNTLDSTDLHLYTPDAPELDYETFWNNPRITPELFAAIHDAGFGTVRIPVTFADHIDENNNISEVWMQRVETVINEALDEGLYVIMDVHGDAWLDLQLDNKAQITQKFETVWAQLALRFKDCDNHLLFEGMNEPRLRNSEYEWTAGTPELREFVNELNQLFVDTVRKTGGNNAERYLLIAPYCNNPLDDAIADLAVPDGNIIASVHLYNPYQFCQNMDGTANWSADNPDDVAGIDAAFQLVYNTYIKQGIPVIFTEYGCVDKNNIDARTAWASYYIEQAKRCQIPCIWWDNGAEFSIIDRTNNTWRYPDIVDIIR